MPRMRMSNSNAASNMNLNPDSTHNVDQNVNQIPDLYPTSACFELTPRCNFRCRMCYVTESAEELASDFANTGKRELTTAEWIRLAEQAIDAGTLELILTGGDPITRPDFKELYTAISEMGFWIHLYTNLSNMTDDVLALLEERPPMLVRGTLYGASEETYEKVCRVKGAYGKVIHGIESVQRLGIPLQVVATGIRENEKELPAMYELAASYGMELVHTNHIMNSVRNHNQDSILTSRVTFNELSEEEKSKVDVPKHKPFNSPYDLCGTYKNGGYWVHWDGTMSICSHIPMDYHPLESSIESCFYQMHEDIEKLAASRPCSGCSKNEYCRACPAALFTEGAKPGTAQCKELSMFECGEEL